MTIDVIVTCGIIILLSLFLIRGVFVSILLQDEYEQLSRKIEAATVKSVPCDLSGDFEVFLNTQRNNHPTIIKAYTLDFSLIKPYSRKL